MTFLDTPPRQSEASFMKQVIELAELLRWRVYHDRATNQRTTCAACKAPLVCAVCSRPARVVRNTAGMLDLLLIRRPRVVWAELKSDRGKVTPDQLATFCELKASGQEAYIWRPRDWPKLERILR